MFSLTVIDLVRLDSEQAARNYMVHARDAERIASLGFRCRIVIMGVLAVAASAAILNLLSPARPYQIASVAASAIALLAFAAYATLGLEARLFAHRSFAHRLWLITERYRSLLSEIGDGAIDPQLLAHRRDELIHELHAIYETGLGMEQAGHETDRLPTLPDQRAA
jgi:conflict system pore-forming effector with SLATT domain